MAHGDSGSHARERRTDTEKDGERGRATFRQTVYRQRDRRNWK